MNSFWKIAFLSLATLIGTISFVNGQIGDKLQYHMGGSYDFLRIQGSTPMYANYFTITGGAHYVFWHSNDQISLSANPNASIGASFNNFTGFSVFAQVPAFIMLRLGAACTKYNEQKFGLGAGVGGSYFYIKDNAFPFNNSLQTLETNLLNPVAAVQLTFQNDFRTLTVRGYGSLLPYSTTFLQFFGNEKFNYDQYGLAILYNF
jgi:hypothetical protein